MVCYSEEKRIIYIHVPKTGGMTLERILIDNYGFKNFTFPDGPYEFLNKKEGQEGFLRYILKHSEESKRIPDLYQYDRFTFVRNVYSRAFSGIRFLSENNPDFYSNLLDFYNDTLKIPFLYVHFNMKQSTCLEDLDGNIKMKYIGRFENFQDDIEDILFNKIGLERKDISKYHIHKTDPLLIDFDKNVVKVMCNTLHKSDFEIFGYTME